MANEDKVDENANLIDDREEATIGMTEIDGFDFDRAVQLMTVIEKCANVGVKATSISGIAQAALNEMNAEALAIAKRRAEEFAKAEADAARKAAEEKRKQEEDEAEEAEALHEPARQPPAPPITPRAIPSRPVPSAPVPDNRRL